MFYCRDNELRKMEKRYRHGAFECIVIYGRRRVGKTALINTFCENKKKIYFSALDTSPKENLRALSKAIYGYDNDNISMAPEYSSFEDAFAKISQLAKEERVVFVIDEYPYLAKSEPSISSRLQHLIDHVWKDSNMYLILCGSSMSFMEYQVLGYESPLYGRQTAQFKIEALNYKETAVFNPELPSEDNALIYGITGGVPHYINKLDVKRNLDDAILENVLDASSYLYEEPGNLLKQELREPGIYNSIITAIAEGASKMNEISTKTGVESGPCAKYMKVLMDLGILKRETPIAEKEGKKSVYLIADNLFRFWYRFVPQNITAITSGRIESIYERGIKRHFVDYMGLVFEKMCRDYLMYYAENMPIELRDIGQWWGADNKNKKQVQIDIVGTPIEGKEYIIGSCKYKQEPIGVDEYELLKEYADAFGKGEKYHFYIFSKSGFTENLLELQKAGKVKLVTLKDLYA